MSLNSQAGWSLPASQATAVPRPSLAQGSHPTTDLYNVVPHRSSGDVSSCVGCNGTCRLPFLLSAVLFPGQMGWVLTLLQTCRQTPVAAVWVSCLPGHWQRRQLVWSLHCPVKGEFVNSLDRIVPSWNILCLSMTLSHCIKTGVFPGPWDLL